MNVYVLTEIFMNFREELAGSEGYSLGCWPSVKNCRTNVNNRGIIRIDGITICACFNDYPLPRGGDGRSLSHFYALSALFMHILSLSVKQARRRQGEGHKASFSPR